MKRKHINNPEEFGYKKKLLAVVGGVGGYIIKKCSLTAGNYTGQWTVMVLDTPRDVSTFMGGTHNAVTNRRAKEAFENQLLC